MDQLVQTLYDIPIAGLLFQLVGYLLDHLPTLSSSAVSISIPILYAALCGVVCERSGVVNIGLEGIMLTAAFVGWIVGVVATQMLGFGEPTAVFGITGPLLIGLVAAVIAGMVLSALHAWLAISVRADQIISGTIINIIALGLTGYLISLISKSSPTGAGTFSPLKVPANLVDLPVVGWLIGAIFEQGPLAISAIVITAILQILLFRSRWGLRTRAVGEHPKAAETVGIDVIKLRYRNVIAGGALAALGGAYLSMELTSSFQPGMTQGRGFIGLAAMIVGRWTPIGSFGAAILFAATTAVGQIVSFAPPKGSLGQAMALVPSQFYGALPYLVTIVILAGFIGRSTPPAADGLPYVREATT